MYIFPKHVTISRVVFSAGKLEGQNQRFLHQILEIILFHLNWEELHGPRDILFWALAQIPGRKQPTFSTCSEQAKCLHEGLEQKQCLLPVTAAGVSHEQGCIATSSKDPVPTAP